MEVTSTFLKMDDQVEVFVKKWENLNEQPNAIVQLSHGMAEHIERYDDFAKFLVQHNIFVYGNDHRGHGRTGEKAGLFGFFSEQEGFERAVDDLYAVNLLIQKEYKDVPIILLGHSMGSFLARRYIQRYGESITGVIISGTGGNPGLTGKLGKQIAKREIRKHGLKTPSPLLNRLSFGSYNKHFSNLKTEFDWLSSDPDEVEKYMNDPLCGFVCSAGYFYDLLKGLEMIHDNRLIQNIPKELPIFIFSGTEDPVGGYSKGVQKVIQQYKRNGLENIESKFFTDGRHEMLNEKNKIDVYHLIFHWITRQLEKESEL
ncbi:alpha/beta hydrolase [Heyndrickxia sp. NPDC080065]|uniref:alpha/beta hydrolase n=1 Tax=Heyndrickxia sp. NPDC080065 TaxID=3390568 RepID=UPI003D052A2B